MKIFLICIIASVCIYGQNKHLSAIDIDYLNYTRSQIEKEYSDYYDFWIVKDEPGLIIYQGGRGFVSWPVYLSAYYFDNSDSLLQINITLADTSSEESLLFPQVLMTFRNWYGKELDYKVDEEGNRYYYWYFGEDLEEAEAVMFVIKNFDTKAATQITQVNLRRIKEVEFGKQ